MVERSDSRDSKAAGGMSTWVKVTLIVMAIAALVVVVMLAVSSGGIGGHQIPEHAPPPAHASVTAGSLR